MSGPRAGPTGDYEALPLVGRSDELDRLRQWLAEALGGSPRVVLVSGDPGIGKTRLLTELIAEARDAGVRPFAGRCLEDSQLPLLPLAAVLDALLPGVGTYRPVGEMTQSDDPGTVSTLVADAGRALMAAAADRPVLLVLEDVQWADQATIDLVAHVAATLTHEAVFRELPAMLLVTARSRGAPPVVQRTLSRFGRETIGRTLRLSGLDDLGVFALLATRCDGRPSASLLHLVQDATSGNPLEIETLLGRLELAGALERRGREVVATVDDVTGLPIETDDDIDALLDKLTSDARDLATTLALLRDGRVATLRLATGQDAERFDTALDDAIEAGLLDDDGVRVDFVDAATQRSLVRSLGGRRRQSLHADIARRLADAESSPHVTAAQIVDQLHRAGTAAEASLLTKYARAAGDEALALGSNSEAARHYEAALRDAELDDATRAVIEERAALATYRNLDRPAAAAHADRAIELARECADLRTWGEAALLRARAGNATGPLEEFLAAAGDHEPGLRARAHGTLCELSFDHFDFAAAARNAEAAERIAREADDAAVASRVEFVLGLQALASLDLDGAAARFRRCEERATLAGAPVSMSAARGRSALVQWSMGALADAASLASEAADRERANGWWAEYSLAVAVRAGIAVAQGNLGAAERFGAEAASAHRRSEQGAIAGMLWSAVLSARVLAGDAAGARKALDEWERGDPRAVMVYRALVDAVMGEPDPPDAQAAWQPVPLVRSAARVDLTSVSVASLAVELADANDDPALAANALDVLTAAYARGVRFTPGWCAFVPRLAGVASMLAGDLHGAEMWLATARADALRAGAVGEAARVEYDRARTKLSAGGAADASEDLERAIADLERVGYRQLLAAARRLAGRPDADLVDGGEAQRVILVTDLIDSTPLTRRVGDRRFVELLREHNRIMRTRLRQFDGVEFKHTGDGIAAWFLTAGAAIECGLRIQEDIERSNIARPEDPLYVRIGISAGEVVVEDERDVYGLAVITAFRVCDHARDGRILVSSDVPPLVRESSFGFTEVGDVVLKGFTDPHTLYAVTPKRP